MNLLESNMLPRESLCINVYASSSLPSITTDFIHGLPTFKYLCNTVSKREVQMPSYVIALVLDGYTFRRNIPWLRNYKFILSLAVSPPSSNRNLDILNVDWALQTVFEMTTPPKAGSTNPPSLTIDDPKFDMILTRSVYLSLLCGSHFPRLQELHLTCGVFLNEIPQCEGLVLEGYDRSHFIISSLFDQTIFASPNLHLIDCTGFTDSELDRLSKVNSVNQCPLFSINLRSLKLTGCHDFTVGALKDMVNARGRNLWNLPWASLKQRHFGSLQVSGYGTPLAVEDGEWLNTHLIHFTWEGRFFFPAF